MRAVALVILGSMMILGAGGLSNGMIEGALLSDPTRSLEWGPTLFRLLLAGHGLACLGLGIRRWRTRHTLPGPAAGPSAPALAPASEHDWMPWGILLVLSILAFGLRMIHLDGDLWYDEITTLLDYVRPPFGDIITRFPSQNQHMLYSVMAFAANRLLGDSAWTVRLPSVLFGVASLWALFLLGRHVVGTREALLSCALMTVSYHHIWFSQNARGYMGLLFFTTLATWLWLEGLARGAWRWWLGYAVSAALGLWIHMTMAFVLAAHGLLYLLLLPQASRTQPAGVVPGLAPGWLWKPFVAWGLCGTLTLQLYALALPEFFRTALHQVSWPAEWSSLLWVLAESLRSLQVGFAGLAVVLSGAILAGLGWLSILYRHWRAGVVMALPPLLAGATMLVLDHYIWPRFFFFAMAFALLILVHGTMTACRLLCRLLPAAAGRQRWGTRFGLAMTCVCIAISASTVPRYYALPKQDFTGARYYVEQRLQPGETVVAVGLAGVAYKRYFAPHWSIAQTRDELDAVRRDHASLWLVYTIPIQLKDYHPDVWQAIQQDFERVKVFPGTLGGGELYVYRLRTSKTAQQLAVPQAGSAAFPLLHRRQSTALHQ